MSHKWNDFLKHLCFYTLLIGALAGINFFTSDFFWVMWPAFGWGVGLVVHFIGILLDEANGPRQNFTIETLQTQVNQAQAYRVKVNCLIKATADKTTRNRLQYVATKVGDWVQAIVELAKRVDEFYQNPLISQDLEEVPIAIESLKMRLVCEVDEAARYELGKNLVNRKNHKEVLDRLQRTIVQTEIKIERAITSIGIIYSQLLMANHVNDYSSIDRLLSRVDDEITTLKDYQTALEEVKLRDR